MGDAVGAAITVGPVGVGATGTSWVPAKEVLRGSVHDGGVGGGGGGAGVPGPTWAPTVTGVAAGGAAEGACRPLAAAVAADGVVAGADLVFDFGLFFCGPVWPVPAASDVEPGVCAAAGRACTRSANVTAGRTAAERREVNPMGRPIYHDSRSFNESETARHTNATLEGYEPLCDESHEPGAGSAKGTSWHVFW
jgi:hypothetical protein